MKKTPTFKSAFLNDVCAQLESRSKAIRHHGKLTWETTLPDDFEWITFNVDPLVGNYCIFQFIEDNRMSVFVRSKSRSDRGRLLLEIEDLNVIPRVGKIVESVEETIKLSAGLPSKSCKEALLDMWLKIEVKVL